MTILKKRYFCPLHHSLFCCGRERPARKPRTAITRAKTIDSTRHWRPVGPGLWRIDDPNHPRGYREKRNKTAMAELLLLKLRQNGGICGICQKPITDMREVDPDHISPRGIGGAWRDDHPDNIQPAHHDCNMEKGSKRI